MRSFSTSIASTTASTSSPFLNSSEGCFTFLVQCRSDCAPGRRPFVDADEDAEVVTLFTLPAMWLPTDD